MRFAPTGSCGAGGGLEGTGKEEEDPPEQALRTIRKGKTQTIRSDPVESRAYPRFADVPGCPELTSEVTDAGDIRNMISGICEERNRFMDLQMSG